MKEKILQEEELGRNKNIKSNFSTRIFDDKLFEWFTNRIKRFCTVQDSNIQNIAMKLADIYRVDNLKSSNGWLQKFKLRHNIIIKFINGESGLVDVELIESFKDIYEKKIKYAHSRISLIVMKLVFFISVRPVEILLIRIRKH
ncbi:Tigger transposable element-derived protein 6 [Dictyocoela muelleri]|nr:Tigger transposable element-derived protein 6 [Dictyocoela muelleri]